MPNLGRIASEMAELQLFFDFAWAPIETTLPIHIYKDRPKKTKSESVEGFLYKVFIRLHAQIDS